MKRLDKRALFAVVPVVAFLILCSAVLLFYHPPKNPVERPSNSAPAAASEFLQPSLETQAATDSSPSPQSAVVAQPSAEEASEPASGSVGEEAPSDEPPPVPPSEDDTVHITSSGRKYHRSGCSSLSKSDVEILLGDALRKGYEPCSVCKPGILPITPAPSPTSAPSPSPKLTPALTSTPTPTPTPTPTSTSTATPTPEESPSLSPSQAGPSDSPAVSPPPASGGDTIVYITASGKKYHLAGCRHLAKSSIETTLERAKAEGYGPCSVCKPPE